MRFGQHGTIARVWGKTGSSPRVSVQTEYDWIYIFGAACPATGETAAILMPYANIDAMNKHLGVIGEMAEGQHILLVMDQAGWHMSDRLNIPDNITIYPLPPYSPELNPIELLWKYLREHYLSNRLYKDYKELLEVGCMAWNNLIENVGRIKSICHVEWALCENT